MWFLQARCGLLFTIINHNQTVGVVFFVLFEHSAMSSTAQKELHLIGDKAPPATSDSNKTVGSFGD